MPKIRNIVKGDTAIWVTFFLLCVISILEVFSASSFLTYKGGVFGPIIKHVGMLAVGAIAILVVSNISCKYFKLLTPLLLPISFLMLLLVFVIGDATNEAHRWLPLGGIQFQPSEIAKGTLILAVAQILSFMQTEAGADRRAMKFILIISLPIILPIMAENLSTAILLGGVIFLMMIIGRVPTQQLLKLSGFVIMLIVVFVALVMLIGKTDSESETMAMEHSTEFVDDATNVEKKKEHDPLHRVNTWKSRILSFFNDDEIDPATFDWDKNGQVAHSRIAIASSNVIGRGFGNSVARDWLPQAFADFIYAIIIEETGIIGAIIVLALYLFLLFHTGVIARNCANTFPAFLAMGLALLLVSQAFFNMCVAVGVAPVTGQPLPLISKGGTSTIINCIYIGVILSVSHTAKRRDAVVANENK